MTGLADPNVGTGPMIARSRPPPGAFATLQHEYAFDEAALPFSDSVDSAPHDTGTVQTFEVSRNGRTGADVTTDRIDGSAGSLSQISASKVALEYEVEYGSNPDNLLKYVTLSGADTFRLQDQFDDLRLIAEVSGTKNTVQFDDSPLYGDGTIHTIRAEYEANTEIRLYLDGTLQNSNSISTGAIDLSGMTTYGVGGGGSAGQWYIFSLQTRYDQ